MLMEMKGLGQFTGALVMLIVTAGFKESLLTASSYAKCSGVCHLAVDKMWRVLIGKLFPVKFYPMSYSLV
jgi:PHS family inorganic phosphate transporter-like MFS transporter